MKTKIITRKKSAAFGIGFFGMFWIGGTAALALYDLIHRMIYGRFPKLGMDNFLSQGFYVFAYAPGDPSPMKSFAVWLLEANVIVFVMTIPFIFMLACASIYGWKALARDFAGLRAPSGEAPDGDSRRKDRNAAFRPDTPARLPVPATAPRPYSRQRPGPNGRGDGNGERAA